MANMLLQRRFFWARAKRSCCCCCVKFKLERKALAGSGCRLTPPAACTTARRTRHEDATGEEGEEHQPDPLQRGGAAPLVNPPFRLALVLQDGVLARIGSHFLLRRTQTRAHRFACAHRSRACVFVCCLN